MESSKEFKDRIKKAAKVAGVSLGTAGMVAAGLTGCKENEKPEQTTPAMETQYETTPPETTQEEKEKREILIDRIIEQYAKDHPGENINSEDIGIFATRMNAWKDAENNYYIHTDPNLYAGYEQISRSEDEYDMVIINKEGGTILCSASKRGDEYVETYLSDYYDNKVTMKSYHNDRAFRGIIDDTYTAKDFYEGAVDLYNSKVYDYDKIEYSDEMTSTVEETEQKVIIEENSKLNLYEYKDDHEIGD